MSIEVAVGDTLPLNLVLDDGNEYKYPVAHVYGENNIELTGSPYSLTHISQGLYRSNPVLTQAAWKRLYAVYEVFDDAAHTIPSYEYELRAEDVFDITNTQAATYYHVSVPCVLEIPYEGAWTYWLGIEISDGFGHPADPDDEEVFITVDCVTGNVQGPQMLLCNRMQEGIYYILYNVPANAEEIALVVFFDYVTNTVPVRAVGISQRVRVNGMLHVLTEQTLTAARAANLDKLDVFVSSRQSSSTALTQFTTLNNNDINILSEIDDLAFDVNSFGADITAIKASTDKIGNPVHGTLASDNAFIEQDTNQILIDVQYLSDEVYRIDDHLSAIDTALAGIDINTDKIPIIDAKINVISGDIDTMAGEVHDTLVATTPIPTINANVQQLLSECDALQTQVHNVDTHVLSIPTNPVLTTDGRLSMLDVPVSTRATPINISSLATKADLISTENSINSNIDGVESLVNTMQLVINQIKNKTDRIPLHPSTYEQLTAAQTAIIDAIDNIPVSELTAAQVWSYVTRTLTYYEQPDLSNIATKADVAAVDAKQYTNRLSTTFNTITGQQEIIVWAEKNGQRVLGTNCSIEVKDSAGTLLWSAAVGMSNSDGIFRFSDVFSVTVAQNYYVVIRIDVDGSTKISNQSFFTVV